MSPIPNRIHNHRAHRREMPDNSRTNPPIKKPPREDVVPVQRHQPQHDSGQHVYHKIDSCDLEPAPDVLQCSLVERMHDLVERGLRVGDVVDGCAVLAFFVDCDILSLIQGVVSGYAVGWRAIARARLILDEVDAEEFAPVESARFDCQRDNYRVYSGREEGDASAIQPWELDLCGLDVDCAAPVPGETEPCCYS